MSCGLTRRADSSCRAAPAKRHRDLQKRNGASQGRLRLAQFGEGAHAIGQPLRIFQPVNADHELGVVQARPQPGHFRPHGGLARPAREQIDVDADWKDPEPREAARAAHGVSADRQPQFVPQIILEMPLRVRGLETDQVEGEHRFDKLAMMRDAGDDVAIGERRMEEEPDRPGDAQLAQLRPER
jgi:hypothetical protein